MKIKKNDGITLVALVVTIIVLMILSGITIKFITDDNGLISTSKGEKNDTLQTEETTENQINTLYNKLQQ